MKGRTFHVLSVEHAELDKERQTDRQTVRQAYRDLFVRRDIIATKNNACCLQPPGVDMSWNYANDVNNDGIVTSHALYAAANQQGA